MICWRIEETRGRWLRDGTDKGVSLYRVDTSTDSLDNHTDLLDPIHTAGCPQFVKFTDAEWAELEAWRIEFLLALEYSRNPPRFPEDE